MELPGLSQLDVTELSWVDVLMQSEGKESGRVEDDAAPGESTAQGMDTQAQQVNNDHVTDLVIYRAPCDDLDGETIGTHEAELELLLEESSHFNAPRLGEGA
eukprot:3223053-Amphidinium_carterae.1